MTDLYEIITLTENNSVWLRSHIEETRDYVNKSELINDLIRSARRAEAINQKLELAEKSGFANQSAAEMLKEFKAELR